MAKKKEQTALQEVKGEDPGSKIFEHIREATRQVEEELRLEDVGWIGAAYITGDVITEANRILNLKLSRLYFAKDPLGRQAVRLWTDYTFGAGMTWSVEDDAARRALEGFWDSKTNQPVLSARGQRKSSDKLLVDGEIFFALFLGAKDQPVKIRRIDPLEITEIVTDPEDIEDVKFYVREWVDRQAKRHKTIYRSTTNLAGKPGIDWASQSIVHNDEALVYHLTFNTISLRGNPLLLPALDWIKQYRRFLASRIAIMLALARFAWKKKVAGGSAAVEAIKAVTHEQEIKAGSEIVENLGVTTTPIKTDSGARNAYEDGRQIKLMIAAAVGIPEQYFGDISIGNLATAKTVELPMMKMFQSNQGVWGDTYKDIDEIVLEHAGVAVDKWHVDRDFPRIAPRDVIEAATAFVQILQVLPDLAYSDEVKQVALMTLGINDPAEVLEQLEKVAEGNVDVRLIKALRQYTESIKEALKKDEISIKKGA